MMSLSGRRSITRGSCAALAAIAMLGVVSSRVEGSRQNTQDVAVPVLRTVRVVAGRAGGSTTVILEADGPLPAPLTGAVDGPPRVYLDLKGVSPGTAVRLGEPDALVRRVRVALHSADPLSTRVVLDLSRPSPYRIDSSSGAQGRLTIVLGTSSSEPAAASSSAISPPPKPAAASSPASVPNRAQSRTPAAPTPAPPVSGLRAAPQRRADSVDAYAAQVSVALERLQALRPVLVAIDRRAEQPAGDLTAAAAEFDAVARVLGAIRVPASRQMTQGLLLRTCALGARASRMLLDSAGTGDSGWNAASAAAGALIMFDQASIELGYSAPR